MSWESFRRSRSHSLPSCRRGFTLVELLITIGIIVVLASIILAVSGRAHNAGYRTICTNNLRMFGTAVAAYAMDNNGYLPFCNDDAKNLSQWKAPGWLYNELKGIATKQSQVRDGALWPYLNNAQVYHCPNDPPPFRGMNSAGQNAHELTSYLMSYVTCTWGSMNCTTVPAYRMTRMPPDGMMMWEGDETKTGDMWSDGTNWPANGLTKRHGLGASYARFDGGTAWITRVEFDKLQTDPNRNLIWCDPTMPMGGPIPRP